MESAGPAITSLSTLRSLEHGLGVVLLLRFGGSELTQIIRGFTARAPCLKLGRLGFRAQAKSKNPKVRLQ